MTDPMDMVGGLSRRAWLDAEADRFERAWRASGGQTRIEEYTRGLSDPAARNALERELLLVEWELRRERGERGMDWAEVRKRFPEQAEWLEEWSGAADTASDATEEWDGKEPVGNVRAAAGPRLPVLEQYELLEELGAGSMGVVYLARKRGGLGDQVVALKMIRPDRLGTEASQARFIAEVERQARVHHPHVVPILDSGVERGGVYFTMPRYPGRTLAEALGAVGRLAPRVAAEYMLAVAQGVGELHRRGIMHRDLKPRNILLDDYVDGRYPIGRPALADFGLAALLDGGRMATDLDTIAGTVPYMAPEQVAGRNAEVGVRSDVWSLGVMLYELVTGRRPFEGETHDDLMHRILRREPLLPRQLRREVPRDLQKVILRCLEKEPERRYESAQELEQDLTSFLRGDPLERTTRAERPLWDRLERWARRKPALAVRVGMVLVVSLNIWVNRTLTHSGWSRPRTEPFHPVPWLRDTDTFVLMDQAVLLVWAVLSMAYQRKLDGAKESLRWLSVWLITDAVLLTFLLWINQADESGLVVAYAVLIAATGLWYEVRLVVLATVLSVGGFLGMTLERMGRVGVVPVYVALHVMTGLVLMGAVVIYLIRRARELVKVYQGGLRR
jgi:serine/threonine protein kinase